MLVRSFDQLLTGLPADAPARLAFLPLWFGLVQLRPALLLIFGFYFMSPRLDLPLEGSLGLSVSPPEIVRVPPTPDLSPCLAPGILDSKNLRCLGPRSHSFQHLRFFLGIGRGRLLQ